MPELTESEALRHALVAEKHAQARQLMREQGVDLWLTFQREGSDVLLPYVLGVKEVVSQSALMLFADGPSVAIVMDYDATVVEGVFDQVIAYRDSWREPLLHVLNERKPERIAINYDRDDDGIDGLTHGQFLLLTEALATTGLDSKVESASPITSLVRQIKTPAEVERMRRACEITIHLFGDVTSILKPGMTELDIYEYLHDQMKAYNVSASWDPAYCPGVVSSKRSAGHTPPTQNVLEPGDCLLVDLGVIHEGYASDLMRTWYVRKPGETSAPPEIQKNFDTVRDAIQIAADALRPGVTGVEVDTAARSLVERNGYQFFHATGHQVGTRAHDGGLLLGPDNARYGHRSRGTVREGMTFTIEPVVGPIGIEENVVVTADGCSYLVPPQREIWLV
ncbi:MAG: Xaa-Pro peptidase family protein [Chloroflexota bacterium]|nr:Xaa-Pro peptidase family protein [Chloroflexota bacterium]